MLTTILLIFKYSLELCTVSDCMYSLHLAPLYLLPSPPQPLTFFILQPLHSDRAKSDVNARTQFERAEAAEAACALLREQLLNTEAQFEQVVQVYFVSSAH
jgi:hypothetical protein